MANTIETSNIDPKTFFTSASRYVDSPVIYYSNLKKITLETYKRKPMELSSNDKFMIIPKGYEYRPDLVSMKAYGLPDFWWRIMEANNINDIYNFKSGLNIRIPSMF